MDRRVLLLAGWVLVAVVTAAAAGCGGSTSPPPTSTAASAPQVEATHRPIIINHDPLDPRESLRSLEGIPPTASFPLEATAGPLAGAEPLTAATPPTAPPLDSALNPLRIEPVASEPAAVPPKPNPLREIELVPRMTLTPRMGPSGAAPRQSQPAAAAPAESPTPAQPLAAAAASRAPATTDNGPYDVVQIFYGTDRRAAEALVNDWPARLVRYLPTMASGLLTLCLTLVAIKSRKLALWMLVFGGVGVSFGLGLQATNRTIAAIRQAGKTGLWYTTERTEGNKIDLGLCEVTIPKTHVSGELEAPTVLRLEVQENVAQHVILRQTERLADRNFYALLKQRVEQSPRKELFVFVHGFNVSFEDAARRTAQIHHDLHFEGAPVFFSWPASDKFVLTYPADESSVATSAPNLKRFLLEIAHESQARSINLIAHSMGNRALGVALREIDLELRGKAKLFNQVILAAPDIDAEDFRRNIAPAMQRTAQRLTLYASSRDDALLASQLLHRGPRAGDAGSGLVVIPGIDTIDVTAIDSSPWGHSYYGSSDPVLTDLKALFLAATPAQDRSWLSPAERNGHTYWIFQPARTATTPTIPR